VRGDGKQELKEKGKTNKQTSRRKQNKEPNKKVSKVKTGSIRVLIDSKLVHVFPSHLGAGDWQPWALLVSPFNVKWRSPFIFLKKIHSIREVRKPQIFKNTKHFFQISLINPFQKVYFLLYFKGSDNHLILKMWQGQDFPQTFLHLNTNNYWV
jgi:hypothetical protein